MNKITYVLRTLSPNNCFHLDSDQAGSFLLPLFPGPSNKHTLSTLKHKYMHVELSPEITKLTQRAPKKSSEQILFWTTWTPNHSTPGDLTAPTY
ncbi:hypothetical protein CHARACLAT_007421 [Characodon lateralis]|uniref:Uncharacterized protein n=1 Tax=Characodon lateralis TaxID=208331 RepID=A0ABU7EIL5_9TELE|nr:hypothetical protein [Characodon lateralis]